MGQSRGADLRFPPVFAAFRPFGAVETRKSSLRFNFFGNFNLTLIGAAFPAVLSTLGGDFFPKMGLPCSRTL